MINLTARISEQDGKLELVGNKLLNKFLFLKKGELVFFTNTDASLQKQGFVCEYFPIERRLDVRKKNPLFSEDNYEFRFIPKSFTKIYFDYYPLNEESIEKLPLRLEMSKGILGFKGYRKIRNILRKDLLIKTEIRDVVSLNEYSNISSERYIVYPGRTNALYGLNSCLESVLEKSKKSRELNKTNL